MLGLVLALSFTAAPPAWCARVTELVATAPDAPDALARLDEAVGLLPVDATTVAAQVRHLAGEEGTLERSFAVLRLAVDDSCAGALPSSVDAASLSSAVRALIAADERFGGVRKGDDVIDRFLHKVWLALARLLESEGMRQYAGSARVVYFLVLLGVFSFIGVRVVSALGKSRVRHDEQVAVTAEVLRRKAFAAWRADAAQALARGDARAALRAGQAALLARIGELAAGAVTPARTHREIVARLDAGVAEAVSPALLSFDAAYFGKEAALDDAARFLAEIDGAEARLPAVRAP